MLLAGRKIIVTGGPTREWIDPVRYLSNASSGKMGAALAEAAGELSDTIFIHGPMDTDLINEKDLRCVYSETTQAMLDSVIKEMVDGAVLVMAAAPADYAPAEPSPVKIKKADGDISLRLRKTPDILKNVAEGINAGRWKDVFMAGFAAETHDTERYALGKLAEKNLDMICMNDVSREGAGFAVDTNIITVFTRSGSRIDLGIMPKTEAASRIFEIICSEIESRAK
jgi:phosphopantothenoylcysteine decarboxylase/phosphopantothenate--cysteine ligase